MHASQRQHPQYNTLGVLACYPVSGSASEYSELQRTQRLISPLIKNCSKLLKDPPSLA